MASIAERIPIIDTDPHVSEPGDLRMSHDNAAGVYNLAEMGSTVTG